MDEGALRLHAEVSPNTGAIGEPVTLILRLSNVDFRPVAVNRRMLLNTPTAPPAFGEIRLRVEGPPGYQNEITFNVRAGEPAPTDFIVLMPQESVERRYTLTDYESLHAPGNYRLVAEYGNSTPQNVRGLPAYVGSIVALPALLTMTGDSDR